LRKIEVSAPGKLMLFGEHAVVYGRPCIVTAVDQRMKVKIEIKPGKKIKIEAPDVGIKGYSKRIDSLGKERNMPKGVRFLEMAVKNFFGKYQVKSGLKIKTKSEFSSKFGFGSSSAVTVASLKGLAILFQKRLDKRGLFDLAYKTVFDVQGVGSGFDLAAAIWGGTIFFVTGGKKIVPLKVKKLPLVIGYTGIKADTPTLVRQVARFRQRHPRLVNGIFDDISFLTQEAKKDLIRGNLRRVGELMNLNQGFLDALGVNTERLSNLIFAARNTGAYGAKLSGAGGGDCMIVLVAKNKRLEIEKAIKKERGEVINVDTRAEGVRIEQRY